MGRRRPVRPEVRPAVQPRGDRPITMIKCLVWRLKPEDLARNSVPRNVNPTDDVQKEVHFYNNDKPDDVLWRIKQIFSIQG